MYRFESSNNWFPCWWSGCSQLWLHTTYGLQYDQNVFIVRYAAALVFTEITPHIHIVVIMSSLNHCSLLTPFSYLRNFFKLMKQRCGNTSWWLPSLVRFVDDYFFLSFSYHKTKFPYLPFTISGTYVSIMVYGSKVFRVSNFAQFRNADDIKKACMAMPKVANGVRKTGAALSAMVGNLNTGINSFSFQSLLHPPKRRAKTFVRLPLPYPGFQITGKPWIFRFSANRS